MNSRCPIRAAIFRLNAEITRLRDLLWEESSSLEMIRLSGLIERAEREMEGLVEILAIAGPPPAPDHANHGNIYSFPDGSPFRRPDLYKVA